MTDAAAQAERLRERIDTDHGLRLRDGSWLDLAHIREVHTVAVSLEDLSGIATTTADLVRAGRLPAANLPWTVSQHDLRTIGELLARPAELILYLRRRTDVETTQKFDAVDELDLFLHLYESGLYLEPDPVRIARELPQFGPPTVAARRRRAAERASVLASRTNRLDAWYFHQQALETSKTGQDSPVWAATMWALAGSWTSALTAANSSRSLGSVRGPPGPGHGRRRGRRGRRATRRPRRRALSAHRAWTASQPGPVHRDCARAAGPR
ncbi:hypothetical protein [Streptomyces doebereineriae]|uniref:Uncharacterized protein n=1 Tax=Streptomyces doebereineriae TaxID=3075528 RepID=A0ABU2VH56_9ACTN|nr:hypothetical protein [Streptomyces sp. DSM 41640]MDT0484633.1 hypothetical protein [Streptomyces sp. DSM 41640]